MHESAPPYELSDDPSRLDFETIYRFIAVESYWAKGVPRDVQQRAVANSINFGIYTADAMVAYARVVSDRATFGWLCDVYVDREHRGRGLSKWLMRCVLAHPELQGLRRWMLGTRDAHGLYAQFGFTPLPAPERMMIIRANDRNVAPATSSAAG